MYFYPIFGPNSHFYLIYLLVCLPDRNASIRKCRVETLSVRQSLQAKNSVCCAKTKYNRWLWQLLSIYIKCHVCGAPNVAGNEHFLGEWFKNRKGNRPAFMGWFIRKMAEYTTPTGVLPTTLYVHNYSFLRQRLTFVVKDSQFLITNR